MKDGAFIVSGIKSEEIGAFIQERPLFVTPKRKSTQFDIPWRNGVVYFDQNAYENTPLDLKMFIKSTDFESASMARNKLVRAFDSDSYVRFIHYADSEKAYYMKLEEMVFGGTRAIQYNQEVLANFSVRPFKLQKDAIPIVSTTKTMVAVNPYEYSSEPIFILEGTGDVTLKINDETFQFKNIEGSLRVDSSIGHCYKIVNAKIINQNMKMFTNDFPLLQPGTNTITVVGNVTKITIEPRWNTII